MKKINKRVLAAAGAAGAVAVGLSSMGAGGAAAAPLPGGHVFKKLADGTTVEIQLFGEHAEVQGSNVAAIPTSREAWVSGKIKVIVGGKASGGNITAGYNVGCQVNLSSGVGTSGGVTSDLSTAAGTSFSGGPSLTLGPGQAAFVPVISTTSGDSTAYKRYNVTAYNFTGNQAGFTYSQQGFRLNGCGGFAEAQAKITVQVSTDALIGQVTLFGKPFSIG